MRITIKKTLTSVGVFSYPLLPFYQSSAPLTSPVHSQKNKAFVGKICGKEIIYPCNNHRQTVYLLLKNLRFSVLDQTEQHNALCGQSTRPIQWCGRLDLRSSVAPTPYPHIRSPRSRRCISCGTKGRISLIAHFSTPYLRA